MTEAGEERRLTKDRRQHKFLQAFFSRHRRRRSTGRRKNDNGIGYVDYSSRGIRLEIMSVLILSLADGVMTGAQIQAGRITEANPLMGLVIARGGIYCFLGSKIALTAIPMVFLLFHQNWRLARVAIRICLGIYILIVVYHLILLLRLLA